MSAIDEAELRRRAIAGVRAEVEAMAACGRDASVIEYPGLLAGISPRTPDRSLFNSVYYEDPAVLRERLDELASAYTDAGVRAWTVWVPDSDRETPGLLEQRGHLLDASPRLMALDLAELPEGPPVPEGIEPAEGDLALAGELNDAAYGIEGEAFRVALAEPSDAVEWSFAADDSGVISCVGVIAIEDDACVFGVATLERARGRGVAGWLLHSALERARADGLRTGSLQASKLGAGVYERIGFRDFGCAEMWEHRIAA